MVAKNGDWDLAAAAAALRRREISSVELTLASLEQIGQMQPSLNAFITIDADYALVAARRADAAAARADWLGPLHGIPLAHKDMFDRAGRVVTCGSRLQADHRPVRTARVLARLDAAGAIDLGGLNMSEFACNPFGLNTLVGPARNPWDAGRIAGGSSSGSAVAVAARLVFGALGSDTGGSVRVPAAFCGVVGLLPTRGRVSPHGAMKLSPSLDALGPLARTARDCALLLQAIAGPDAADPVTASAPTFEVADVAAVSPRRLKIGILSDRLAANLPAAPAAALTRCVDKLRDLGAGLVEVNPPDYPGLNALAALVMLPEMASLHECRLRERGSDYTPWVRARLAAGLEVPAIDYFGALRVRARVAAEVIETLFAEADAVLLPVQTETAPRLDEILEECDDRRSARGDLGLYTRWTNYVGLPAVTLPCGLDDRGLPIAMQLVARPFAEAILLAVASGCEQAGSAGSAHSMFR